MPLRLLIFTIAAVLLSACAGSGPATVFRARTKSERPPAKVWLVSNGWHTSIALRTADAPRELREFAPRSKFLVIGWGGRAFYMWQGMEKPWRFFTEIFLPSASAVHVIPVATSLEKGCPNSEIIEFAVTEQKLERLRRRLMHDLDHDKQGRIIAAGPGKIPASRFFEGTETYFFPKTCNSWAARHLRVAGVPMVVAAAFVADNICWQGRKCGKLIQARTPRQDPL